MQTEMICIIICDSKFILQGLIAVLTQPCPNISLELYRKVKTTTLCLTPPPIMNLFACAFPHYNKSGMAQISITKETEYGPREYQPQLLCVV